jgi:hypothetical protein
VLRPVAVAVAFAAALASPAVAQQRDSELGKPAATAAQLFSGPSLYETGRVADSNVTDPGTVIERRRELNSPGEAAVHVSQVPGEQTSLTVPHPTATADPAALEREVRTHMATLPDCRLEVARHDQIRPDQVIASEVVLRWTILPTGTVADTTVVATQPADASVMACIKQRMNSWAFSPLAGASTEIERRLVFAR